VAHVQQDSHSGSRAAGQVITGHSGSRGSPFKVQSFSTAEQNANETKSFTGRTSLWLRLPRLWNVVQRVLAVLFDFRNSLWAPPKRVIQSQKSEGCNYTAARGFSVVTKFLFVPCRWCTVLVDCSLPDQRNVDCYVVTACSVQQCLVH